MVKTQEPGMDCSRPELSLRRSNRCKGGQTEGGGGVGIEQDRNKRSYRKGWSGCSIGTAASGSHRLDLPAVADVWAELETYCWGVNNNSFSLRQISSWKPSRFGPYYRTTPNPNSAPAISNTRRDVACHMVRTPAMGSHETAWSELAVRGSQPSTTALALVSLSSRLVRAAERGSTLK